MYVFYQWKKFLLKTDCREHVIDFWSWSQRWQLLYMYTPKDDSYFTCILPKMAVNKFGVYRAVGEPWFIVLLEICKIIEFSLVTFFPAQKWFVVNSTWHIKTSVPQSWHNSLSVIENWSFAFPILSWEIMSTLEFVWMMSYFKSHLWWHFPCNYLKHTFFNF